jgi:hypothetical protein
LPTGNSTYFYRFFKKIINYSASADDVSKDFKQPFSRMSGARCHCGLAPEAGAKTASAEGVFLMFLQTAKGFTTLKPRWPGGV